VEESRASVPVLTWLIPNTQCRLIFVRQFLSPANSDDLLQEKKQQQWENAVFSTPLTDVRYVTSRLGLHHAFGNSRDKVTAYVTHYENEQVRGRKGFHAHHPVDDNDPRTRCLRNLHHQINEISKDAPNEPQLQ
jgi:hypothetical protein